MAKQEKMSSPESTNRESLMRETAQELEKLKKQGFHFDRPDQEIIEEVVFEYEDEYPDIASGVKYLEWDSSKKTFNLVDKPGKWNKNDSAVSSRE